MARMKSVRIRTINWNTIFEDAKGSYYDYMARVYSGDETTHLKIVAELRCKDWSIVETSNNDLTVMLKDRHIIRISQIW